LYDGITEYSSPAYKGTMRLQKLALLWMVKDKRKKLTEMEVSAKGKERIP